MKITETDFSGLYVIDPDVWEDQRGFLFESYNRGDFLSAGIDVHFQQHTCSRSKRNVLRGLHFQVPPHAQDKLVRVASGEVFDVAVDLRSGSDTFMRWKAFVLSETNRRMLFIPKGFAHGFCVLSQSADFVYSCSSMYEPGAAKGIRWDDSDIGIDWPVKDPVLSQNDQNNPPVAELPRVFS